jgi:hypothetical protein
MEIAYAVVAADGAVNSGLVTENAQLDLGAQVTAAADGSVFAAWQSSPSNNLVGDATQPNSLQVAQWSEAGWASSQAAELNGTLWWQLAAQDSSHALVVADQDTDGDLATGADREIFAYSWDGSAWGAQQLSDNDVADLGPHAAYNADGTLAISWLQGEQAMGLIGDLDTPAQAWMPETILSASFAQARLIGGANGTWHLVWPDMAEQQPELLHAAYDAASQSWAAPEALMPSADQETRISGAALADGSLVLGLMKLPVETREAAMDDGTVVQVPAAAEQGSLAVWQVSPEAPASDAGAAAGGGLPSWVLIAAVAVVVIGAASYFVTRRKK